MPALTNILTIHDSVDPARLKAYLDTQSLSMHKIIECAPRPCPCETARERFLARLATSRKTHGAELFGDLPEGQP